MTFQSWEESRVHDCYVAKFSAPLITVEVFGTQKNPSELFWLFKDGRDDFYLIVFVSEKNAWKLFWTFKGGRDDFYLIGWSGESANAVPH